MTDHEKPETLYMLHMRNGELILARVVNWAWAPMILVQDVNEEDTREIMWTNVLYVWVDYPSPIALAAGRHVVRKRARMLNEALESRYGFIADGQHGDND